MLKYFNPEAIKELKRNRQTSPYGFKYGFVEGIFKEDCYQELIKTFPDTNKFSLVDKPSGGGYKRFYVGPIYKLAGQWGSIYHLRSLPKIWLEVIKECGSEEFQAMMTDATGVKFNSIASFGFAYGNGGCMQGPHIDGAIREGDPSPVHGTIACLLYCNAEPGGSSGTAIYDRDRETVLFQVKNLRNSFFYFEQHPDSWHGFPKMAEGDERRLVNLTYSLERSSVQVSESFLSHIFGSIKSFWTR